MFSQLRNELVGITQVCLEAALHGECQEQSNFILVVSTVLQVPFAISPRAKPYKDYNRHRGRAIILAVKGNECEIMF
jgi:hypothetical protein